MLKNLFLNTSTLTFSPPNDDGTKTPEEIEREQIEVEEIKPTKDKEDDEVEDKDAYKDGETDEDKEDEEEPEEVENETAEQKAIREAAEAANTDKKSARQVQRMQKRIDTLTAKSRTTETENIELKKLLDAKKEDGSLTLTEEEVERRAELKAEEKLTEREFKRAVNLLAKDANTLDKNFNKNINAVTSEVGLLPPVMIGILEDLENDAGKKVGAEVLVHLSKNIDDYEDIFPLSEGRMALKLQQLANKITKKAPKAISQVPAPNEPIGGNRVQSPLNDKMTDDEWINKRNAEVAAKRRA